MANYKIWPQVLIAIAGELSPTFVDSVIHIFVLCSERRIASLWHDFRLVSADRPEDSQSQSQLRDDQERVLVGSVNDAAGRCCIERALRHHPKSLSDKVHDFNFCTAQSPRLAVDRLCDEPMDGG